MRRRTLRCRSNARGRGTGRPHRAIPRQGVEVGTKKGPVDAKADRDRGPQKQARRGPPPRAAGRATLHKLSASLRQEHASGRRPDPAQLALPHAHEPAERSASIASRSSGAAGVGAARVGAAGEGAAGQGATRVGAALNSRSSRTRSNMSRRRTHSVGGLLRWPTHSPARRSAGRRAAHRRRTPSPWPRERGEDEKRC